MGLNYKIDCKLGIIFERLNGMIRFNQLNSFQKSIISDSKYDESYSIFSDIRGSVFEISKSEKETLYNTLKTTRPDKGTNRRCAFLTIKPKEVVGSELIKITMQKFSLINIKTFSTKDAAFQWLNIDKDFIIDFD